MRSGESRFRELIVRYVSSLRFPYLLALTAGLFLADLLFPDVIPFVDEALLGLLTLLLARMKRTAPAPGTDK